jgi:hypothetical protein
MFQGLEEAGEQHGGKPVLWRWMRHYARNEDLISPDLGE